MQSKRTVIPIGFFGKNSKLFSFMCLVCTSEHTMDLYRCICCNRDRLGFYAEIQIILRTEFSHNIAGKQIEENISRFSSPIILFVWRGKIIFIHPAYLFCKSSTHLMVRNLLEDFWAFFFFIIQSTWPSYSGAENLCNFAKMFVNPKFSYGKLFASQIIVRL